VGIDIHGWVEISELDQHQRNEDYAWSAVIDVGFIIRFCDELSHLLFGFSFLALTGGQLEFAPIAMNRGIPPNPSWEVRQDLKQIRQHEEKFGFGEFSGYTYIDMSEIDAIDWAHYGIVKTEPNDWWLLFGMIDLLRADQRFASAGVRLVCWIVW
jgi:hypothetical protein